MAKYIDADALKQMIVNSVTKITGKVTPDGLSALARRQNQILDMIDEMPAADVEPVRRWISVDERLPEYEGSYLVCTAKGGAFIGHYYTRSKSFTGGRGHVTHWMDRPETPKMDGGSE